MVDLKNRRIFLSGNRGFVGTHLEKELIDLKYEVLGFDIKQSDFYDVRFIKQIEESLRSFKPDVIIHLAALTGVRNSLERPLSYFRTNIDGTYNLLKVAEKHKIKKFLFASSSSVYGNQKNPLKENMHCDYQLSPYAISKKAGELLCRMFDKVPTTIFRPFTVYGENGRGDMVIKKLMVASRENKTFYKYGNGNSSRGYTNVHDLVDGIISLIDYKPKNNFEIFNLGGNEIISLNRLIKIFKKIYPKLKIEQVERNPVDVLHNFADITKARRKLNWRPIRKFNKEIIKLCQ